ncbi:MAG: hypothetical protein JWP91_2020 [Fibrobacteres bacterium]|nr:hypothetical protein [Fibrobacterota bacterium]
MSVIPDSIRIGNGAGFWGDNLDAPIRLAELGALDFLTLEYLAELTLSILAHQRRLDPESGYVGDFPATVLRLIPILKAQPNLRIVTNAGGLNPAACAREVARHLTAAGMGGEKVAWVSGDDLMPRLAELRSAGERFRHFDSGEALGFFETAASAEGGTRESQGGVVSANVYLGAAPICEALDRGARIVITGRVADASLTLGPAMHAFRWGWKDWDKLAAASAAGHLIECGAQVTGGLLSRWQTVPDYAHIGYPIAILDSKGGCRITKPEGTGGVVSRETVTEQLLYEIGDPARYHTPDVTLDFTDAEVTEIGPDLVEITGVKGVPPPATLKVSCAYSNGFSAKGDLVVSGRDAAGKAKATGEMILDRVDQAGFPLRRKYMEVLGSGATLPGVETGAGDLKEVVLRISVWDKDKKAVERFCREISPVITSGPPGISGYAGSRPKARPMLSYWPTVVERDHVRPVVYVRGAEDLAE